MGNRSEDPRYQAKSPQDVTLYLESLELMRSGKITLQEAFVLSIIQSLINVGRDCFMSNKHWGKLLGVSEIRARHIITSLKKKGYVRPEFEGFKRYLARGIPGDDGGKTEKEEE